MLRGTFLERVLGAVPLATLAGTGIALSAESYPARPITLIVPWGVGGGADQMARAAAEVLQADVKVTVPVINVPGADGNNGMVKLVGGDADGYTLAVLVADTFFGNALTKSKEAWQLSDIVPLAVMNRQPFTYFAAGKGPYKSWADIEAASKKAPVKIAIDGFGSVESLLAKFVATKGVKLVAVPFAKPGERYAAVLGGQVDLLCEPDGNVRRYIEAGQLRPLVVFDTKRVPEMGSVPTGFDLGYKVALSSWRAIVIKAGTDPAIVKSLSDALARVYKAPEYQKFISYTWSAKDSFVAAKDVPAYFESAKSELKTIIAAVGS